MKCNDGEVFLNVKTELGLIHTISPLARWVNLAAFWQQIVPIVPFLPVVPVCKCCAVYYLRSHAHHGMEEVIGSIPIRSTNSLQQKSKL
jgi:hypothetical protein